MTFYEKIIVRKRHKLFLKVMVALSHKSYLTRGRKNEFEY